MPAPLDPSVSVFNPEISVALGGYQFTIPALPASRWLAVLLDPRPDGSLIVPGFFTPEEQDLVDDLLFGDELPVEELRRAVQDAVTVASGHNWWWTENLLSVTRGEHGTHILGKMAHYNPDQMPLAAWINALYAALIPDGAKEMDIARFDTQLETPPADVEVEISETDVDTNTAAFFGMMRQ